MQEPIKRSKCHCLVLVGPRATVGPPPPTPFEEKVFEKQREEEGKEEGRAYSCSDQCFPAELSHMKNQAPSKLRKQFSASGDSVKIKDLS